ncbi:inositol monophosphatase family protein [Lactobacillus sp. DCY120]|uniref:Inositol monophosphatase family protein n=1 Tax=Bombilactobacillus apium TaxID=2675299 RepID=A0A850QYQ3_9LACO|nr:inositol monophosphatase family protein [Bombilactobacillus apium]NVY96974.1 inositol monophosphatase family protein [Bombilactobacillus apium]
MNFYQIDFWAQQWVLTAGEMVQNKLQQKLEIDTKANAHDFVTNIDKSIEQYLTTMIRKKFPQAAIISEEGYGNQTQVEVDDLTWVIDPIDGTSNLVYFKKDFAIVLSVYAAGQGKISYIYDVMDHKLYHSLAGEGCFVNNRPLATRPDRSLEDSALGCRFDFLTQNRAHSMEIMRQARTLKTMSCASLGMVALAKGEIDGMINKSAMKPWDLLPGLAFAQEAGVQFLTLSGQEFDFQTTPTDQDIIAAGPHLNQEILAAIPTSKP